MHVFALASWRYIASMNRVASPPKLFIYTLLTSIRKQYIIMTVLVTGSSGKTARRLVALLKPSHQVLIASRSGADVDGIPAVRFDWADPDTYANPYSHPQAQKSPIKSIYLVSQPGSMRPFDAMKPFIDTAKLRGVKRFVLLSAIREDQTTPGTGQVHAYLEEIGVEWAVLRPTWFMGESSP